MPRHFGLILVGICLFIDYRIRSQLKCRILIERGAAVLAIPWKLRFSRIDRNSFPHTLCERPFPFSLHVVGQKRAVKGSDSSKRNGYTSHPRMSYLMYLGSSINWIWQVAEPNIPFSKQTPSFMSAFRKHVYFLQLVAGTSKSKAYTAEVPKLGFLDCNSEKPSPPAVLAEVSGSCSLRPPGLSKVLCYIATSLLLQVNYPDILSSVSLPLPLARAYFSMEAFYFLISVFQAIMKN